MKRIVVWVLVLMLMGACAMADLGTEYTNVPGTPTQDSVLEFEADLTDETGETVIWPYVPLQPDELTMDTLTEIYEFVRDTRKRPVRWFPLDVQEAVRDILGGGSIDIVDILHMSEFMRVKPDAAQIHSDAVTELLLDVEYYPGQLVVVMIGCLDDVTSPRDIDAIEWIPLKAEVPEPCRIRFVVPEELAERIQGKEILFNVLTVRDGGGYYEVEVDEEEESRFLPSKDSEDMTVIQYIISINGHSLPDDFKIFLIKHTQETLAEIERIREYMRQEEGEEDDLPIIGYFDENVQNEASLLLEDGFDLDTLLAYEIKHLSAEGYHETYGDAVVGFVFPTPYENGQEIVSVLGVRNHEAEPDESQYLWTVLRTEVIDGTVDVTFKQRLIPIMEDEGAILIVLSEPLEEIEP